MVMDNTVAIIVCSLAALLLQSLEKSYFGIPYRELHRRARRGSGVYPMLQLVARFDITGKVLHSALKWFFIFTTVILISREFRPVAAFGALVLLLFTLRIAATRQVKIVDRLAALAAPDLSEILRRIDPVVKWLSKLVRRKDTPAQTDIYDKEDLKELLQQQKRVVNNRIETADLDNALHALDVRFKKIGDHMVLRTKIHFVTPKDPIGPILLSELHKSGFSCFPVQGNAPNEVVGILYLDDLVSYASGGTVANAMSDDVYYVREDQKLEQVLQAFTKTGRYVFMVVNRHGELSGLITVNDVLDQLLGSSIYSDFASYDDISAVASGKENAPTE